MRATQSESGSKLISPGDAVTRRTIAIMLMAKTNITVITARETVITVFALRIEIVVCMSLYVSSGDTVPSNLIPGIEAVNVSLIDIVSL